MVLSLPLLPLQQSNAPNMFHFEFVLFVILVIFRFGFEGWIWVLIASVPDLCILLNSKPTISPKLSAIALTANLVIVILSLKPQKTPL